MKQFFAVFKFEFCKYSRSKVFIILTVIGVLLIAGFLSYPTIIDHFSTQDATQQQPDNKDKIGIMNHSSYDTQYILELFETLPDEFDYEVLENNTIDYASSLVKNSDFAYIIVLNDESDYTLITATISINDSISYAINDLVQKQYQAFLLKQHGLDLQTANEIINAAVNQTVVETGKNQIKSFFYTYLIIMLLYMSITIYGNLVATSVASEKNSRAMETLITTVSSSKMMFGKVLGVGSIALLQIILLLGSSILFYNINISAWQDNSIIKSIFDIPIDMVFSSMAIFILGFFLYAFIFAVIGSLAKRLEDVNTSVMPLILISMASFMIVLFSMTSGNIDSTLMKICTYIPFTAPMALPARYAMSMMKPIEFVISVLVLILSVIGIGFLASGIYRIGVLLYGKTPSIKEIYKLLKSK